MIYGWDTLQERSKSLCFDFLFHRVESFSKCQTPPLSLRLECRPKILLQSTGYYLLTSPRFILLCVIETKTNLPVSVLGPSTFISF